MDAIQRFSEKAGAYSSYRWDYAAQAVRRVIEASGLTTSGVVADVGSGTGMLARHFVGRVGAIFVVEPNREMRDSLMAQEGWSVVAGTSSATTLPTGSVDMITVGRALHWFPPQETKAEFRRILRPGGWMAVFSVPCTDEQLLSSLKSLRTPEYGWDTAADKRWMKPVPPMPTFYFGHDAVFRERFPGLIRETWEDFLGRLCSLGPAPGVDHPLRPKFERAARAIFERHAADGILAVQNATEVVFGQPG